MIDSNADLHNNINFSDDEENNNYGERRNKKITDK